MVLLKCKSWSWILLIHSCVCRWTHVYCICHIKTILSEFWNQASRITLICFFSHTITFFGAYLSGHMVKNGMSYHTYTFPNPTNPFFFGSGERSGTKALYAKNGRNRLKVTNIIIFCKFLFLLKYVYYKIFPNPTHLTTAFEEESAKYFKIQYSF